MPLPKPIYALNRSGRSAAGKTIDDVFRDLRISDDNKDGVIIAPTHGKPVKIPGGATAWVETFQKLSREGKQGFYESPVAEAIVKAVKAQGGYLILEDLKIHGKLRSLLTEPVPFRLNSPVSSEQGIDL